MKDNLSYYAVGNDDGRGVGDRIGLLRGERGVSKANKNRIRACRMLIVLGLLLLLLGTFGAGLVTGWRWNPRGRHLGEEKIPKDPQVICSENESKISKDGDRLPGLENSANVTSPLANSTDSSNTMELPDHDPGTNRNAPTIASTNGTDSFSTASSPNTVGDSSLNPLSPTPKNTECVFEYVSQLGFDGSTPIGDLRRSDGRIERDDVRQGALGNCGFLAAIIALIGADWQLHLQRAMTQVGGELQVNFRFPAEVALLDDGSSQSVTRVDVVKIDDKIPASLLDADTRLEKKCDAYLGAIPSGTGGRPIVYVPMLEKAWVKYTDANPDLLRSRKSRDNNDIGYLGIQGTSAALVLQAITGLPGQVVRRRSEGLDLDFFAAILRCITESRPCVVGTKTATDVVDENGNAITNDAGIMATNINDTFYDVIEKGSGRVLTFVGNHAYALDLANSDIVDGEIITFDNAEVTIYNPWQYNRNFRMKKEKPGGMRMRLKTLAYALNTVYSV